MIASAFLMFMSIATASRSSRVMPIRLPLMLSWCCRNQMLSGL